MVRYAYNGITIEFTRHAVQRVGLRFNWNGRIPNKEIQDGLMKTRSDVYHVSTQKAVFVCRVVTMDWVRIVTVYERKVL